MNQTLEKTQSWWQLLSIQVAGTICLPVIMIGQLLCQSYGWVAGLLCVGIGNVFLLSIGYLLANLSTTRRQTTVEHATFYFGNQGGSLFASIMLLSVIGWFGIQLNVISMSFQQIFKLLGIAPSFLSLNIGIGLVISLFMCLGMKAMKSWSYVSAPLLGVTLLYACFSAKGTFPEAKPLDISWLSGLTLIVGANIAAVIDLPTFFRHARSKKDACISIIVLYGLIVPSIEIAGVYLSAITNGSSIFEVLQIGHGKLWMLWISFFVIASGFATNNANLYSAVASSYSLPGKFSLVGRTLFLGGIGTFLATLNPLGNIESLLNIIGIAIGSMGAVMASSYLIERNSSQYISSPWASIMSWSSGVVIGLSVSIFKWFITGVPAFDAFIVSFLLQVVLQKKQGNYETADNR